MRFNPTRPTVESGRPGGFTLAEVLAALLLMAILVPVALEGVSIVSRSVLLGEHKVAAMRVAARVLNEQLLSLSQGQLAQSSSSDEETDGDTTYPWTMQTEPWPQDAMTQMTVSVTFAVRGVTYQMHASTLFDPNAAVPGATAGPAAVSSP